MKAYIPEIIKITYSKIDFLFNLAITVVSMITVVIILVDFWLLSSLPISIKPMDILFFFESFSNASGYLGAIVGLIALHFTYKRIISTDKQLLLIETQINIADNNNRFTNYYKMLELFTYEVINESNLLKLYKSYTQTPPKSNALPIFQCYYGAHFSLFEGRLPQSSLDKMIYFLNTCDEIIGNKQTYEIIDLNNWKKLYSLCLPVYSPIIDNIYKIISKLRLKSIHDPKVKKEIQYSFHVYWNISMII